MRIQSGAQPTTPARTLNRAVTDVSDSAEEFRNANTVPQSKEAGAKLVWRWVVMGCTLLWQGVSRPSRP